MDLESLLLGLLLHRSTTGYELARELAAEERHLWNASSSQVYTTLRKLESRGELTSRREPSRRGPERRPYRLTEAGQARLAELRAASVDLDRERVPWLARVRLLEGASDEEARRLLGDLGAALSGEVDRLSELLGSPESADDPAAPGYYRRAAWRCALATAHARRAWCEQTLAALDGRVDAHAAGAPAPTGDPLR